MGDNISYQKLQSSLATIFNKKPAKRLSRSTLIWLNAMDWYSHIFFGYKRRMQKSLVEFLFEEVAFDSSKIENDLEFVFTPIDTTLKRVAERYSMSS